MTDHDVSPSPTFAPIPTSDLPEVVRTYLAAHAAGDVGTAIDAYAPDAVVTDENRTYRGHAEIRGWLDASSREFRYTSELVAAERHDEAHVSAVQHLEGDFPGGVVDLRYAFTLRDGLVAKLTIAPR